MNDGGRAGLLVTTFAEIDVEIAEGFDIVAVDGVSNGNTGLLAALDSPIVQARVLYAHDMNGTAAPLLGSVPRVISSGASGGFATLMVVNLQIDIAEDVHGYIVLGDLNGGVANVYQGYLRGAADNGVYNVGDAAEVNVHDFFADDVDEMFVNSGTGVINAYHPIGRNLNNAIGLQNCSAINIYDGDLHFAPGVAPFKTRLTNTASGAFRIFDSRVDCTPANIVCDFFSNGTLEEFIDKGNSWVYRHDSAVWTGTGGTANNIVRMAPGSRCLVESDSDWTLTDETANVPASTSFLMSMPTVTELSYWDSRHVNMTGVNSVVLRLSAARQQLFSFRGKFAVINIESETEENNGALSSAPPRTAWGTGAPTAGYWQAGSIVTNRAPSANGVTEWICTVAGTPGTWIANAQNATGQNVPPVAGTLVALNNTATYFSGPNTGSIGAAGQVWFVFANYAVSQSGAGPDYYSMNIYNGTSIVGDEQVVCSIGIGTNVAGSLFAIVTLSAATTFTLRAKDTSSVTGSLLAEGTSIGAIRLA